LAAINKPAGCGRVATSNMLARKNPHLLHVVGESVGDLETGIHLRWTLRDIKGKRTKFSPASPHASRFDPVPATPRARPQYLVNRNSSN
jgi:hypothetical protein